jgi:integrase
LGLPEKPWRLFGLNSPWGNERFRFGSDENGKRIGRYNWIWDQACRKAGLRGKLFHDVRRTAVRNLIRSGTPEVVAMRITGHKTRSVFDRYNIVSHEDLREATKRHEAYIQAQSGERK